MLEVIGLFLAASDFAGWTPKIEAALDLLARSLWRLVEGLNASRDPEKQKPFSPAVERPVTYVFISLIGLIMIALLVFSLSMGPPPPLQDISHAILSIVGFLLALVFAFFFFADVVPRLQFPGVAPSRTSCPSVSNIEFGPQRYSHCHRPDYCCRGGH
jgi:hypothetical protein